MAETAEKVEQTESPLDPRERRLRALELMSAEGGISKESLMEECELTSQPAFSRLMRELKLGDHYAVVNEDGNYVVLSYEDYLKWTADKPEAATKEPKTPKKDLKDLQNKRQRHFNAINAKRVALDKVQVKFGKDANDQLTQVDMNIAFLNVERMDILYNRWKAKCATDLELASVGDLDSISDLDQYVNDRKDDDGKFVA